MRRAIGLVMMAEGLETGVDTAVLLPGIGVYDGPALALLTLRALVGVALFSAGWILYGRREIPMRAAAATLVLSAALRTIELGARVTPTNLFPSYRWAAIGLYWGYALAAASVLLWNE